MDIGAPPAPTSPQQPPKWLWASSHWRTSQQRREQPANNSLPSVTTNCSPSALTQRRSSRSYRMAFIRSMWDLKPTGSDHTGTASAGIQRSRSRLLSQQRPVTSTWIFPLLTRWKRENLALICLEVERQSLGLSLGAIHWQERGKKIWRGKANLPSPSRKSLSPLLQRGTQDLEANYKTRTQNRRK